MTSFLNLRWTLLLIVAAASQAVAQSPSYEVISRCFFIYAAAHEAARDMVQPLLFQYTQPRVGWMAGFMTGHQSNEAFASIFDANITSNKQFAMKIDRQIRAAIKTQNSAAFDAVIDETLSCDAALGIKAEWRPRLAP